MSFMDRKIIADAYRRQMAELRRDDAFRNKAITSGEVLAWHWDQAESERLAKEYERKIALWLDAAGAYLALLHNQRRRLKRGAW